jgi:hypothetical protein
MMGKMLFDIGPIEPRDKARGYAALPGSGPPGETCETCRHCTAVQHKNRYYKCELMRNIWTGSRSTDIRLRSPACRLWKK